MTTQHIATPVGPAGREERDPGAWVAPTIATAHMAVLGPAAAPYGGLSEMATAGRGPDDCPAALNTSPPGSAA